MTKKNFLSVFLLLFLAPLFSHAVQDAEFYKERPEALRKKVEDTFTEISKHHDSHSYMLTGNKYYILCGIEEEPLLKALVGRLPEGQKTVRVMDLGSGDPLWGGTRASLFDNDSFFEGYYLEVFSLTGGKSVDETTKGPRSAHYFWSGMMLENLLDAIEGKGLPRDSIQGTFDLVVSSWCITWFNDPVGSFFQVMSLLKAGSPFIFTSFSFDTEEEEVIGNYSLLKFLSWQGYPILACNVEIMRRISMGVLQTEGRKPTTLRYGTPADVEYERGAAVRMKGVPPLPEFGRSGSVPPGALLYTPGAESFVQGVFKFAGRCQLNALGLPASGFTPYKLEVRAPMGDAVLVTEEAVATAAEPSASGGPGVVVETPAAAAAAPVEVG